MPGNRRTAGLLALGVACGGAIGLSAWSTACFPHNCDGSTYWLGIDVPPDLASDPTQHRADKLPTQRVVDDTHWESAQIFDEWADFPGLRSYVMLPGLDGFVGPYTSILVYVATDPKPNGDGGAGNFTLASGNIAEIFGVTDGGFTVFNASCAHYYVRVVVERGTPVADAGADEAGAEGGLDGGLEEWDPLESTCRHASLSIL